MRLRSSSRRALRVTGPRDGACALDARSATSDRTRSPVRRDPGASWGTDFGETCRSMSGATVFSFSMPSANLPSRLIVAGLTPCCFAILSAVHDFGSL